jgi:asparagine synthase (glutamine-hydrolysing)
MVYNLNDIEQRLIDLAFFSMKPRHNKIKQFLLDTDGEFIVLIYDKQEKGLCIFNDRLGRLPLYYHKSNDLLVMSREIKFIYPFLESIEFDKTSLMEYLLYEFPLGERTLIRNVNRLLPATAIQLNINDNQLYKKNIVPLNFDVAVIEESIATLKKLFLNGLENRVRKIGDKKPLISLSGGLDSRATLGGLVSLDIKPDGITYDLKQENRGEIDYVQKIAEEFGIPLRFLEQSKKNRSGRLFAFGF